MSSVDIVKVWQPSKCCVIVRLHYTLVLVEQSCQHCCSTLFGTVLNTCNSHVKPMMVMMRTLSSLAVVSNALCTSSTSRPASRNYTWQINHALILNDIVMQSKQCPEQHQAVATEAFYQHIQLYMRPKQSSSEFAHQEATVESSVFEMMSLPLQLTISLISKLSFVISLL